MKKQFYINYMQLSLLFISIYIFFYNFSFFKSRFILLISLTLAICNVIVKIKHFSIYFNKVITILFIILLYNIFSLLYTPNFNEGYKFVMVLSIVFLYICVLIEDKTTCLISLKMIIICSSIHVIMTLIQLLSPETISLINRYLLSPQAYANNMLFFSYGYYSGICEYNLNNALYISLFIAINFSFLVAELVNKGENIKKKKIVYIFNICIAVIPLIATQKRGLVVATIIAMLITTFIVVAKHKKAIISSIIMIISFTILLMILVKYNSFAQQMWTRFFDNDDILSGRDTIYQVIYSNYLNNPILGYGVGATYSIADKGAHNVYLQILYENGLIGFILYIFLFLSSLVQTITLIYRRYYSISTKKALFYSLYSQILFLAYCMSGNPLYDNFVLFVYVISISIPLAILRQSGKKEE